MAPGMIRCAGFAPGTVAGLAGKLAVCTVGMDLVLSEQPEFDINISVWNQDEAYQSRHLSCYQFGEFDFVEDLQAHLGHIFTPKFQMAASSVVPLWAVPYQRLGSASWATDVWQVPGSGVPTVIVLPPVSK
jgi:hypothetical protein